MARVRSPNYPQISLADAVRRVEQIRSKEGRNPASRDVLAKLLGFGGLNGASMGVLSAISKYGLLEDAGDKELKVSDLADSILFPHTPDEKHDALWEAASNPPLFREILEKWTDHPPSDENLRSYLMRRGFSQGALNNAISCYRDTMELVTAKGGAYASSESHEMERPSSMPSQVREPQGQRRELPKPHETAFTPASGEPFQIVYTPGGKIRVSGELTSPERADEFIKAIQALKLLMRPSGQAPRPTEAQAGDKDEDGTTEQEGRSQASVSIMITQQQKDALRERGCTDEQIREMKPEDAHRVLGIVN